MRFKTLTLDLRPPFAEIRLLPPASGAEFDRRTLDELDAACGLIHDDDAVIVALLTAEDGAFTCESAPAPERGSLPFRALEVMGQPVIAVIEGEASGAGLELALACDLRVASERATFALPAVSQGAVPSGGATARLPRLVGRARATEMILLGEPLDADAALACGLVNAVAPHGQARPQAERMAATIASRGPVAVRYAKEAVLRGLDMPLEQALRYETDLTVILQTTADRAEGVRAFLEKRPPRFEGR